MHAKITRETHYTCVRILQFGANLDFFPDGEPLPLLEADKNGESPRVPRNEAALKKATKDLGKPIATMKIKLHPRTEKDICQCLYTMARHWYIIS